MLSAHLRVRIEDGEALLKRQTSDVALVDKSTWGQNTAQQYIGDPPSEPDVFAF